MGAADPQLPLSPARLPLQGADPDGLFTEDNVMACVLDIVMAGTETTSITLQWAALLMAKHPSVQGERAGCPGVRQDGPSHPRAGVPQA